MHPLICLLIVENNLPLPQHQCQSHVFCLLQECSALAYMLDHLVCSSSASDKDTAGHVRVLIAALASCNHAPDAQTILVTEVCCGGLLDGQHLDIRPQSSNKGAYIFITVLGH